MKQLKLQLSIGQYVCFGICLLLMAVVPIVHSHKLIGYDLDKSSEEDTTPVMTVTDDGSTVINTTEIGKDIIGYGGPTPVEITIKGEKIKKIKILPNRETPEFLGAVNNSPLLESLDGKTLREASQTNIDGVTGATYTSSAVIRNIKAGVSYALDENNMAEVRVPKPQPPGAKFYCTLAIIACGAILPWFVRSRKYRFLQLALNVAILGFWGGTFISYSNMVSCLTNGMTQVALVPVAVMLLTAFIYPMFGKVDYYCTWLCPYGSLQELAGKCVRWKIPLSARVAKSLDIFRRVLWFALMWLLWTGLWFDWMGYEPFAAFFIKGASPAVLAIAGTFLLLSLVVQRPYCRFVCPTGSLFKFSEGRK